MKKSILLLVLLLSSLRANAYDLNANASWPEITQATPFYFVLFPQIQFANAFVSIDNVCLEPDGLTLYGGFSEICTQRENKMINGKVVGRICTNTSQVHYEKPVNPSYKACIDKQGTGCEVWKDPRFTIPLSYSVPVYPHFASKPINFVAGPAFTKTFSIPSCSVGGTGIGGDN